MPSLVDSPQVMSEGSWRLGVLLDDQVSDEQADRLAAVFGGQLGGPMEALTPLVGGQLGVERVPMEVAHENGTHCIKVGGDGRLEVQEIMPLGKENVEPARFVGILRPAGDDFAIAKATWLRISAFGIEFDGPGRSAFASPFGWAA